MTDERAPSLSIVVVILRGRDATRRLLEGLTKGVYRVSSCTVEWNNGAAMSTDVNPEEVKF